MGTPSDTNANGADAGAAYVFDARTGEQLWKLLADDGDQFDQFAFSVALSGDIAILGAPGDDDVAEDAGAAYLFDARSGAQLAKLVAGDGGLGFKLGQSVAIDGAIAVAGAWLDGQNGFGAGAAYLFDVDAAAQIAKLAPSDGPTTTSFGYSAAVRENRACFGAWLDDANGYNSGSAYVFSACAADFNGDGTLDTRDIIAFLNPWAAGASETDWDHDGGVDPDDVADFLADWIAGC